MTPSSDAPILRAYGCAQGPDVPAGARGIGAPRARGGPLHRPRNEAAGPQDLAKQRTWRVTVVDGGEANPHDCLVQVFDVHDPESPHRALLDHIGGRDRELSEAASHLQQNAQTYLAIASGKLDEHERIHPFQNLVSLFASALGAAIVDPAAAIVTTDPAEWADAMEQSLHIEKEMGALRR